MTPAAGRSLRLPVRLSLRDLWDPEDLEDLEELGGRVVCLLGVVDFGGAVCRGVVCVQAVL